MEPQKTQKAKAILRINKAGGIMLLISNYITKLQQLKQYGIGIKTDIYISGTEQRAQKDIYAYMVN